MSIYFSKRIFRIIHADNTLHILSNGLVTRNHEKAKSDYVALGSPEIIKRRDQEILPPFIKGNLEDFIPFYFNSKSPMLYNVITGRNNSRKTKKEDIIIIGTNIQKIIDHKLDFFFTDGHALNSITEFYTEVVDLAKVDWKLIDSGDFSRNEKDLDKIRRYQAEFHVRNHVPIGALGALLTYDIKTYKHLQQLIKKTNAPISVYCIPEMFC